jgi:ribosome maturation factor RimP
MGNKANEIEKILSSAAQENGFEILEVEYVREDGKLIARIYMDKEGGVNLDDCEKMSRIFDAILDKNGIINESYVLEVSSPGIYRPLKKESDYERFIGDKVRIQTLAAYNNQRNFIGKLISYKDAIVRIDDVTNGICEIEFSNIKKANLEPDI